MPLGYHSWMSCHCYLSEMTVYSELLDLRGRIVSHQCKKGQRKEEGWLADLAAQFRTSKRLAYLKHRIDLMNDMIII